MAEFKSIDVFKGSRDASNPAARLEEVRNRSRAFRGVLEAGNKVLFYKACELVRVPYPTRYAFTNCYTQGLVLSPIIHIVNRLFVIQYDTKEGVKTLLFSPSDIMANAEKIRRAVYPVFSARVALDTDARVEGVPVLNIGNSSSLAYRRKLPTLVTRLSSFAAHIALPYTSASTTMLRNFNTENVEPPSPTRI